MKGKRSSVVWTEQNIHAKAVNSYDKTKYTNILEARLGNFLGKFKIIGDRHSYPLELKIADRLLMKDWHWLEMLLIAYIL